MGLHVWTVLTKCGADVSGTDEIIGLLQCKAPKKNGKKPKAPYS